MTDYIDFVETLARDGQDRVFFNSGPIHAAIVMSRIFKYSHDVIKIYCGGFNGAVSNDEEYLKQLQSYLEKGGKLEILVEADMSQNESSKIYRILRKHKDKVNIKHTPLRFVNEKTRQPIHFTTGDGKMFRLETGTSDYTAQVNFGDTDQAKRLDAAFNEVFNKQQNVAIPLA